MLSQLVSGNQLAVPKHGVVYLESMIGDRLYILARGSVRLTGTNAKHSRDVRAVDSFGEAQLVNPGPRDATATALMPSTLIFLSHADLFHERPLPPLLVSPSPVKQKSDRPQRSFEKQPPSPEPKQLVVIAEHRQVLIGTIVAMLVRSGRWDPGRGEAETGKAPRPKADRDGDSGEPDFEAMRRSVKQHKCLADYTRELEFGLRDEQEFQAMEMRFGRQLPIVSTRRQNEVKAPSTQAPAQDDDRKDDDGFSPSQFVAAGRLGWLSANQRNEDGAKWSRYRLSNCESSAAPAPAFDLDAAFGCPAVGRVAGRVGTPPQHLRGVRPRDQRLNRDQVAVAQQRADDILDSISDKHKPMELLDPHAWLRQLPQQAQGLMHKFASSGSL